MSAIVYYSKLLVDFKVVINKFIFVIEVLSRIKPKVAYHSIIVQFGVMPE